MKNNLFNKKRHHIASYKTIIGRCFDSISFQKSKDSSEPGSTPSQKCFFSPCKEEGPHLVHHDFLPYNIESEERCGRLLRASHDILAGEVIFTDLQGLVGPRPAETPHPVCLTCYRRLSRLSYRCQHCGWPLCSYYCSKDNNSLHARECSFFRSHRRRYA